MKINDITSNSSFIELSSDEAAKVNGGYSTNVVRWLAENQDLLTSHIPDFSTSGIAGIDANIAGILTPLMRFGRF
jgi:hypothetical protein